MSRILFEDVKNPAHSVSVDLNNPPSIIICDLDGTICDSSRRLHKARQAQLQGENFWKTFFQGIEDDPPISHILDGVQKLQSAGTRVKFCTGRNKKHIDGTAAWLGKHNFLFHKSELYMRDENDYRADVLVKSELLDQILNDHGEPRFILEDRKCVADMYRLRGFNAILVAEADY